MTTGREILANWDDPTLQVVRVRLLCDDPGGRFASGEDGVLLANDYPEKYAWKVLLRGTTASFLDGVSEWVRVFYFYHDEIEIVSEP